MVTTLIEAGLLRTGEKLFASLDGKNGATPKHFEAELVGGEKVRIIDDGGDGSLNGKEFASTSAAITALYRRTDGGWKNWRVERGDQLVLLDTIRDEYDRSQAGVA